MAMRAAILFNIALTALSSAFAFSVSGRFFSPASVFHQKLDHFDPQNKEYFKQRYYKFDYYFRDGAPIFLEIGGEFALWGIHENFTFETAIKNNALVFALEHRYYGESLPESYSGGRPTYLSSEQALADIAYFIEYHKKFYPNSPWIVNGCSYAGNLATWMRLKYPHLVNGAIAGSAPVLAKMDFYEYFEVVGEVLKEKVPQCYQKLVEAKEELTALTGTSDGRKKLAKMFRTEEYSSCLVDEFQYALAENVAIFSDNYSVQYLPYYQSYTSEVCTSVTGNTHGKSILEILINMLMHNETSRSLELITRDHITIGFRQLSGPDLYMWEYQFCNEFGYFQILSSNRQPFGVSHSMSDWPEICQEWNITLEMVEENVRKTNLRYGGKTPNVTNVVFMHGSNDPWSTLGVLSDLSESARAFVFEGLSHCEFESKREYFAREDDRKPKWMQMFDEIESIIRTWF
ncbi:putative serine protease F56F10.1 [Anabrus simplex]|uniref:putative serine protease F56F10.1 n=1 Tax=Anabrus simplex TaxID=316456 RepID=UPI0035A31D88